ncbi:MAG: hypothetical protein GYB65_15515 [Chloroflexi bacterium]|nr:hypothetical protein [Chloroflexota bacterium]
MYKFQDDMAPRKKKSKNTAILGLMGLTLAILLAVVAFFISPPLVDFGREQSADLDEQLVTFEEDNPDIAEYVIDYSTAVLLWIIMFGLSLFFVSLFLPKDASRETLKMMGPSPANKEAVVKQLKKDLRAAKKRQRQRQRAKR